MQNTGQMGSSFQGNGYLEANFEKKKKKPLQLEVNSAFFVSSRTGLLVHVFAEPLDVSRGQVVFLVEQSNEVLLDHG